MSSFRFGSHLPVLMKLVAKTSGDILELGSGYNSTVYLHWACFHTKRKLVTLESKQEYYNAMLNLGKYGDWHKVKFVEDWAKEDLSGNWDIVLIDHSPGKRRPLEIERLKDVPYIVVHDTEPSAYYGYEKIWDMFKYRFDYKDIIPNTTVLSNKYPLERIMD
jgi:hypothetical protein